MTMKRSYLKVPGQRIELSVKGPSGCGKTALIEHLQTVLGQDGVIVSGASVGFKGGTYVESFYIECPTPAQAQARYFETLGEHEIATLKGHLAALGYEL
jgi:molybdopterin-guanine dinucleotide biosynthesis protein